MTLVKTDGQSAIRNAPVNIGRQVVENLQGQMSQRLLGALDELSGIRLGEGDAEIFAHRLPGTLFGRLKECTVVGVLGKGIQVSDQTRQVFVADVWLEAQFVL